MGLFEAVGFFEDFALIADDGDKDLAEKLHLEVRKTLFKERHYKGRRLRIFLLEWDRYHGGFAPNPGSVGRTVEVHEPVYERLHQRRRPIPIYRRAEYNRVTIDNLLIDTVHIIVLAAILALPANVTPVALGYGQITEQQVAAGAGIVSTGRPGGLRRDICGRPGRHIRFDRWPASVSVAAIVRA